MKGRMEKESPMEGPTRSGACTSLAQFFMIGRNQLKCCLDSIKPMVGNVVCSISMGGD